MTPAQGRGATPEAVAFDLGPLPVALQADPALALHLGGLATPGVRPAFVLELGAAESPSESPHGFDGGGLLEGTGWTLRRAVEEGGLERVRGTCAPTRFGLLHALRFATQPALLRRGWMLLHAASVRLGDGVHVFAGPSGVGKTTLARALLEVGAELFGDEVALVGRGECAVHPGQPWSGSAGRRAPLVAIHLLARDGTPRPVPPAEALRSLLSLSMVYETGPEPARLALEAAAALVASTPVDLLPLPALDGLDVFARDLVTRGGA